MKNALRDEISGIKFNLFSLSFDPEYEKQYLDRYIKKSLFHVRIALIIAILYYGVFGLLDIVLAPKYKYDFWVIRYALVVPYFTLLLILSYSNFFKKYMQFLISSSVLLAGVGIIWMILIGPDLIQDLYYAGLILVFFYGYTFFKLRFIWASSVGWTIVIIYEIAAIWIKPTPFTILINNNFFFLAGNIMGMVVSYAMEYYSRRDFVSEQLLEEEKRKVEEANTDLEKNVQERTLELVRVNESLRQEISERKRAQDLLLESEQKYRTLFEESRDVIFISSTKGKILDINQAGVELFGYESKEELFSIDINKDLYYDSSSREEYKKLMKKEGYVTDFEIELKKKDGQKIVVQETSRVIYDKDGKIIAYHGILRDVTEKIKLQAQLLQVQKMESIGLLAGGVAHDFNNILTAINGYAELLLLKMQKTDSFYKTVEHIKRGGERASKLTSQLLAFSRKQVYQLKVIDVNALIRNLDKMINRLINEDIKIEMLLSEDVHSIKADPSQVEQVILNLVINARDAINQRAAKTKDKKIVIKTKNIYLDQEFVKEHMGSAEGEFILLAVSDTGIGMDEATKEKVFEPFFTTKETGKGTGLGLSTVYGIVKQNKGSIYIDSQPLKGATFEIYWPSEGSQIKENKQEKVVDELKGGRETILYVEDDYEVREFTSEALKSLGYRIIQAQNGKEALAILSNRSNQVKLILTDLIMPEMGGKELAEIIMKVDPNLKILFTSGYSDNHMIQRAIIGKNMNFIQKPYTFQSISQKIRMILDN